MNNNTDPECGARIDALRKIYRLYDAYVSDLSLACEKYCADCCTANVTMTGLEAELMLASMDEAQRNGLLKIMADHQSARRFQPRMTTNQYAALCRAGQTPPDEQNPPDAARCPLLAKEACTLYGLRPFVCRCMVSTRPCREHGHAEVDDFTLTVNTVFLQFIEHLDHGGFFGNFTDVVLRSGDGCRGAVDGCVTVSNHPISMLMAPPEHHERIRPLIDELSAMVAGVG